MEEEKKRRLEAKLRQMIELNDQARKEKRPAKIAPQGTRIIRRRKGAPDKHIC